MALSNRTKEDIYTSIVPLLSKRVWLAFRYGILFPAMVMVSFFLSRSKFRLFLLNIYTNIRSYEGYLRSRVSWQECYDRLDQELCENRKGQLFCGPFPSVSFVHLLNMVIRAKVVEDLGVAPN